MFENDIERQYKGVYCNDLWFEKAESFMKDNITKNRPFFCYISTNLPHGPNQVPDDLIDKYMKKNMGEGFARYYGMIEHVDNRFGQLIDKLIKWGVYDNTLIFFTSDNGNAFKSPGIILKTLRGKKGDVYDGGVRVPAVWGGGLIKESGKLKEITAHVDFMPTVLEVCGVALPTNRKIDGKSLWPLLKNASQEWPQRFVFIRHGFPEEKDLPESYEFCAVRGQKFKMVQQRGWDNTHIGDPEKPEFELYDMEKDPGEYYNISAMHPTIVENYRMAFDLWWKDIRSERADKQFVNPRERLHIGSTENPFDFRNWDEKIRVTILDEGPYNITIRPILMPTWKQSKAYQEEYVSRGNGYVRFSVGDTMIEKKVKPNDKEWIINNIKLPILYPAPYNPTLSIELSHPNIQRSDISIIIKNIEAGRNGRPKQIICFNTDMSNRSICTFRYIIGNNIINCILETIINANNTPIKPKFKVCRKDILREIDAAILIKLTNK